MLALALAINLTSCGSKDLAYSIPEQRPVFGGNAEEREDRVVLMTDLDAPDTFVRDISDQLEGSWRWCAKRPTVRLRPATNRVEYVIDFAIADASFAKTGPVTVSFLVNDHVLSTERYDRAGRYKFQKQVPADWIRAEDETLIGAEVSKTYRPDKDARELGLILVSIGLQPAQAGPGTGVAK